MTPPNLPPIPIPARIRELLAPYPDVLKGLREGLDACLQNPTHPAIEGIMWAFKDTLMAYVMYAQRELKAAKLSGDTQAIADVEAKLSAIRRSSTQGFMDLNNELDQYLDEHADALK